MVLPACDLDIVELLSLRSTFLKPAVGYTICHLLEWYLQEVLQGSPPTLAL
jgi:hypothetical protein